MNLKKTTSLLLTATLILSLTGCMSSTKKYESAMDDIDFEKIEYKEYKNSDPWNGDFKDGVYLVTDEQKSMKKLAKDISSDLDTDDVKSIIVSQKISEQHTDSFSCYVITFNSKDYAENFYDDYCDYLKDSMKEYYDYEEYGNCASDKDDNYYVVASDLDLYGATVSARAGCYIDGKDVICIVMLSNSDEAEDYIKLTDKFCNSLDITSPSDLL